MPSVQAYGGPSWLWSCLLPPSTLSLFAHVLTKLEGGGKGVTWSTFTASATPFWPFSTATVFGALAADIVLYALLAWYLDKARGGKKPKYRSGCGGCGALAADILLCALLAWYPRKFGF